MLTRQIGRIAVSINFVDVVEQRQLKNLYYDKRNV